MSHRIVEIIPNDLPDWAVEAMAKGQLFHAMIEEITYLTNQQEIARQSALLAIENVNKLKAQLNKSLIAAFIFPIIAFVIGILIA